MKNKSTVIWIVLTGLILSLLFNCKKEAVKTAPLVSILEVPTVNGTSAIIKIEIAADGGAVVTERGICWGTNENPTINDSKVIASIGGDFTGIKKIKAGIVSDNSTALTGGDNVVTLTDLLPNTNYYIRAYAINSIGVGYSSQTTLKTLALAPVLTTSALTVVSSSSVSSGGEITYDGGDSITARGVCWSTNQNPTIADLKTSDGKGKGSFTSVITGLTLGSTYYFRAYATNSAGTSYGNQVTANTGMATVTTGQVYFDTGLGIQNGNNVTSDGGLAITARGLCWGTNPNPTIADNKTSNGTGKGSFSSYVPGLTLGTTYYFRAYATNSAGTAYGNQIVSIAHFPVMIATSDVIALTSTSVKSGGNITSDGGAAITERGVCWSTHTDPTLSDNKTNDGTGTGIYVSTITGLLPGTMYYFRAYAINIYGTVYSKQIGMRMATGLPAVTTNPMDGVFTYSATAAGNVSSNGGGSILSGFCWGINPLPTINDNKILSTAGTGNFKSTIFGLSPNTLYHVRAYSTNSFGTVYGDDLSFRTNEEVPPTEDFIPLQVGNYWELKNENRVHTLSIDKIENLNGIDYYRMIRTDNKCGPLKDTLYFRKTSDGKVYQRGTKSSDEIIRFNLAGSSGDKWKIAKDPTTTWNDKPWTAMLVSKSDTVKRSTATFSNCYIFYYDMVEVADDPEWGYWLAPGIGFVKFTYAAFYGYPQARLTKAKINGVETVY